MECIMNKTKLILTLVVAAFLSGCIPSLVLTGATTTGVVAAQERSAGNAVDDAGIKLTIYNLYARKDLGDLFKNVTVRAVEGRVMLTGNVNKPESSIEAVRLAWQASGVREVINEIQVNDRTGVVDYVRDGWIATQVRTKLLFEKNVRSINYSVEVVNNVVYLMGIAQDEEELRKVTYLASITPYVKQVVSHVVFKDDQRRKAEVLHQSNNE
jgi:osmotically-inducible protein OsmY